MSAPIDIGPFMEPVGRVLGHRPDLGSVEGRREFFRVISAFFAMLAGDLEERLSTRQIAELVGRHPETVRLWCANKRLGAFDDRSGRYYARLSDVAWFWTDHFGVESMPPALRARLANLVAPKGFPALASPDAKARRS